MAGELAVAVVKTEVDLAGIDKGFNEAEGKTNASLASLGANVGKVLTGVVLGAVQLVVAAVAAIGAAAFDVSSQFQSATNNIRAQLGLTAEEAERLGGVIADVYANNFGQSIEDVGQAIAETVRQLGDLGVTAEQEIQRATESAFMLRDAFGVEVPESLAAVRTLMREFGLTSEQAFDLITTGFQEIPAFARDGLDTIGEYSNLFSDAGFSAEEMFSIMESGAEGGQLATDKVADAVKEMGIRLNEGAAGVSEAFTAIGMDFEQIQGFVASGDETWADYFDNIVSGLQGIEDPILRNQAAVAIFGTMAEDLGPSFVMGLDPALRSLDEMSGRTAGLNVQYANFSDFVQGMGRRFQVALKPLGDALLDIAMSVMPLVEDAFAWFETTLMPVLEFIGDELGSMMEGFIANLQDGMGPIDAIVDAFLNWTQAGENLSAEVFNILIAVLDFKDQLVAFLAPIVDTIAQFVSWKDVLIVVGVVVAALIAAALIPLAIAIAKVMLVVAAAVAVVSVLRNVWESNFLGIRDFVQAAIGVISNVIQTALANIQAWWAANGASIIASAQNAWSAIQNAIAAIIGGIQAAVDTFLSVVQGWWQAHGDSVMTIVNAFMTFVRDNITEVITNIQLLIEGVLTGIRNFWQAHGEAITNIARDFWAAIMNEVQSALDFIGGIIDAFALLVQGDWQGFLQTLWDTVVQRFNDIKDTIMTATGTIVEVISGFIQNIIQKFNDTDWGGLGRNIMQGILNGLQNMAGAVLDWIRGLLATVWQEVIDYFLGGGGGGGDDGGGDAQANAGGGLLGGGVHQPAGAATPAWMGGGTVNNFNLTVSSGRSMEDIVSDFYLMQAAAL